MVNCRSPRSPLVERKCEACGNMFMAKPSNVKAGSAKACSKDCSYKVRKTRSEKAEAKNMQPAMWAQIKNLLEQFITGEWCYGFDRYN